MNDKMNKFVEIVEAFEEKHGKFDAAACLRCIEIARNEMKAGKYSVESFLKAKDMLLEVVKCESDIPN